MNQPDNLIIETIGLGKSFGDVKALQNVNLKVARHSIFGFLGPNGAGKTARWVVCSSVGLSPRQ